RCPSSTSMCWRATSRPGPASPRRCGRFAARSGSDVHGIVSVVGDAVLAGERRGARGALAIGRRGMHNHTMEWVVTIGAAGALLVGVAGSMVRARKRAAAWQGRVEARWRAVADELGGTLEVGSTSSLTPRRLALRVASEEVVVTVAARVPGDPGAPS